MRADLAALRSTSSGSWPTPWQSAENPSRRALEADEKLSEQIAALEARERTLTTPDKLRGLMEPGDDMAGRWAAAPMATRREVARIVLAADRVGVMAVQRTRTGTRVPAIDRVTWLREA